MKALLVSVPSKIETLGVNPSPVAAKVTFAVRPAVQTYQTVCAAPFGLDGSSHCVVASTFVPATLPLVPDRASAPYQPSLAGDGGGGGGLGADVNVMFAGVESTTPAESTARTSNVCVAADRPR